MWEHIKCNGSLWILGKIVCVMWNMGYLVLHSKITSKLNIAFYKSNKRWSIHFREVLFLLKPLYTDLEECQDENKSRFTLQGSLHAKCRTVPTYKKQWPWNLSDVMWLLCSSWVETAAMLHRCSSRMPKEFQSLCCLNPVKGIPFMTVVALTVVIIQFWSS